MKNLDEIKKEDILDVLFNEVVYNDGAEFFLTNFPSFTEQKLVEFMGKHKTSNWTFGADVLRFDFKGEWREEVNLFEAVLNQVKAEGLPTNDLRAEKDFFEALIELNTAYTYGRDTGTNGFMWNEEASDFFDKNKRAILEWFDDYANEFGENIGSVLQNLDKKFNVIEDLLCFDGVSTKALLARQLMYEVSYSLFETTIQELLDNNVLDEKEFDKFINKNTTKARKQ